MTNQNVQTNRHGPQNKGCNQASADSKHYLVSKLRPPCPWAWTKEISVEAYVRDLGTDHTRSWDDPNCRSSNVVYGVECSLCGLIYVCETNGQLRHRMSGHRYEINNGSNQLLYQHFNLLDHSILSFKVRILEKIYHPTNNPGLSSPLRRQREDFWIIELGTAAPYGCNDKIDSVGNLSSPRCSSRLMWWGSLAALKDVKEVMYIGTTIVLIFMLKPHLTLSFHMYSSH